MVKISGQTTATYVREGKTVKDEETHFPVELNTNNPAYVYVKGGLTVKIGDFSFGKVDIGITYPSDLDKVNKTYELASEWVDERLQKEHKNLRELKV